MAYNTPETVADYLARFQMEITHRGKGTFTPDHVKYSLTIASGGKDFFTTFESNPHVHGEPTITQVFGALASDAMVVRDYGMDEFVDEFCDGMKPSAAIRAYNSCKETYDWMRDGLYLSNGDIASLSEVISENEEEIGALVEKAASERAARYAYDHPKLPKGFVTIEQLQGDLDLGDLRDEVEDFDFDGDITEASGAPAAAHRASYPLVEFYDTSQDTARFPGGQFVSRYYMTDLLEDDSIAVSLDTMLKNGNQFSLDGGIPAWTVEGDDLAKVNDFLKKSCMEFCGSLPGDEKDEDGYSLTGEAKDATASRNGLSRNQMGIEEKAAECKEAATVLANGNAL